MQNLQNFPLSSSQIEFQVNELAKTIISKVQNNEVGGTLNFDSKTVHFIEGYLVSEYQPSIIFGVDNFKNIDAYELAQLIKKLYFKATKFHYIGFWVNKNKIYIDLTQNILNKSQAIQTGILNKQIAIWDCKNNNEINLLKYSF